MATYYKKIKGKNYDGKLINKAERSVKGRGDGRISLSDAKALLKTVRDSSNYTDIEKATMRHIRDNFDFTPEADRWFRTQIRKWAATKTPGRAAGGKTTPKPSIRKKRAKQQTSAKKNFRSPHRARVRRGLVMDQEYTAPPSELIEREPITGRSSRSKAPVILLLLLIAVILGLFLYPKTREWIQGTLRPAAPTTETAAVKPDVQPAPSPVKEIAQPDKKAEPPAQEKQAAPHVDEGNYYIVQVHEGLVTIAEKELGDYRKWVDLYRLNSATIPNTLMLYSGQKLKMPDGWKGKK
jgi:nucleoid-associated protein YgaU